MDFPGRPTAIQTTLRIADERQAAVVQAVVKTRGWLPLDEAAEVMCLSPSRFSHASHSVFGMAFRVWQMCFRMEMSAQVLMATRWSMAEIADEFQYYNQTMWGQAFRSRFDRPPLKYRQQYLRELDGFSHGLEWFCMPHQVHQIPPARP